MVVNPLRIKRTSYMSSSITSLLCYTGKIHVSANIIKGPGAKLRGKRTPLEAMCEVKPPGLCPKDELLKGNLHSFGKASGLWLAEQEAQ